MKHLLPMLRPTEPLDRWVDSVGGGASVAALASLLPDAVVFVVDADRRILFWSDGAERLLGFKAGDVLGQPCGAGNRCRHCASGCGISERGVVEDAALTLHHADGRPVRLRKTARAFFDDAGAFLGGVEVLVPDTTQTPNYTPRGEHFHELTSVDEAMHAVFQVCRNVADTHATVLVRGESGTGKELIARAIHAESPVSAGPMVSINCASLSPTLMESELFGHEKGAFTGASQKRDGIFVRAHGGTLFLDEVAELPIGLQAKLLRVLEEREVLPVGGSHPIQVDVRLIAATHRALRDEVQAGRFREDLLYRLRVVPIYLPPLRDRRGDVEALAERFIAERNRLGPRLVESVAPEAMRALLDHSWPGNVRELRNVVEYAFAVGRGPEILRSELPPELRSDAPVRPTKARSEEQTIRATLAACGGHLGQAAEQLGISRATLWRKRKQYGI